ncbi:tryptophan-rich sensory protein [bacterium]|nr:MAG: tryptophan-rich sensory protein [bacterium]
MKYKRLAISLAIPQLAGLAGSFFTAPAIQSWYVTLQKPSFSPPNWIFGPAWITLYLIMGVSIYLIWDKLDEQNARGVFRLFWIHLFFNATWSMIFFGLHNPMLAFINIAIIWIFIIVLIFKFWKINKWASYLLVPYFFWVSFASVLNYFIWYLN